ncbi:MAG: ATP-dependent DNA helicase [Halobacteriaceae archaeon]
MTDTPNWREYFGFDAPYDNQADAVEAALRAGQSEGYLLMEGACGTGKTMAALTAATTLLRETDRYDNVVVVTPVKQQLRQFVADLRTLNEGLDDPVRGVALVGKPDLCPYSREGVFPDDVGVHDRCEDLREATAGLVDGGDGDAVPRGEVALGEQTEDVWWDPGAASDLAAAARVDADGQHTLEGALSTAGATAPYRRTQPTAPASLSDGDGDGPLYCPYEADWYARNRGSPFGFEAGDRGVVTAAEFLPAAVERGTCPHRAMGVLLEAADVVVGNYNHLFDPRTRGLTESILDERTFVVVDEAHRIEERVRDLLSRTVGRHTLRRARRDCGLVVQHARERAGKGRRVEDRLADHGVSLEDVDRARAFYDDALAWLTGRVTDHLREAVDGYDDLRADPLPEDDVEIPLQPPGDDDPDAFRRWAEEAGYEVDVWRTLGTVGAAAADVLRDARPDRATVCASVGGVFERWWDGGDTAYFREIELEYAPTDPPNPDHAWERTYRARYHLFNCVPDRELHDVFASLGGGVLMSATLEPLDVFREITGMDRFEDRPVLERTFGLPFPPENRASWVVDATPFTHRNRGAPGEATDTREEYAYVLRTLARSPGRVLLALPNYREAAWAGNRLAAAVDAPVFVDQPSSAEETDALLADFFDAPEGVLVTSTRGTLTEGVDYPGEKLSTCAVVGVPLVDVSSPRVRAVESAYDERFGADHGFEYALTVPAVRRARQAIGRVLRGPGDVGVRALVGRRYTEDRFGRSVRPYFPATEREEFTRMTPEFLAGQIRAFWADRSPAPGRR